MTFGRRLKPRVEPPGAKAGGGDGVRPLKSPLYFGNEEEVINLDDEESQTWERRLAASPEQVLAIGAPPPRGEGRPRGPVQTLAL